MKITLILILSLTMMCFFTGCSKNDDNIIVTGQIQELNIDGNTMILAVFSGISEDMLHISFDDNFQFPFKPVIGQTIEVEIKPEISEIFPPKATCISIKDISIYN